MAGAQPDLTDDFGRTPLMWAAQEGRTQLVELLLAHDANPVARTSTGWTAHRYATSRGHTEAAELINHRITEALDEIKTAIQKAAAAK